MNPTIDMTKVIGTVDRPKPKPDMVKVNQALRRYGYGRKLETKPTHVDAPPVDAALRKPLKNHGTVCKGYMHPHFLHGS